MSRTPVIAVVGATGAQGGGLARALLADPERPFAVRALTRHPGSAAARALAEAGAEVVAADLDDRDGLARAFDGAHGAFLVTPFWAHMSPRRELAQARNMAEAARTAGVRHVVWSTLEDTRRFVPPGDPRMPDLTDGLKVPHYDAKGEADAFFTELGVPTTFLRTSFYWDNLVHFGMGPRRGADGTLVFSLPVGDKRLPGIAADDIGPCARGIFLRGDDAIGRTFGIAGGHLTGAEMARDLGEALGEPVRFEPMTPAAYRALGFPGADDLGNMFQFKQEFEADYCGARPLDATRALHPGLQTFPAWLARHARQIPLS